mgnify:CR=1 FL=1
MAGRFEEICNLFVEKKKRYVRISTICVYRTIIDKHLIPYFKDKEEINDELVQGFILDKLNCGYSTKRIKDRIVVLKRVASFSMKLNRRERNLSRTLFPLKEEKKNTPVRSKKEERKLILYLETHFSFENLGVLICLQTGLRIGEICGLMWKDISIETNEISVNRTIERIYLNGKEEKTKLIVSQPKTISSKRSIPLSSSLLRIRKPLKKIVNDSYYLLTNSLKPIEPRVYRKHFNRRLMDAGIKPIRFHGLRHTFATRCIEYNANCKAVSSILGHSNISTTLNLYVHPNGEEKKKCIEVMMRQIRKK